MDKAKNIESFNLFDVMRTLDAIQEKCGRAAIQFRQVRSEHEQRLKIFTATRSQNGNKS